MKPRQRRRLIAAGLFCLIAALAAPQVNVLLSFPDQLRVFPGQSFHFDVGPLFSVATIPWDEKGPGTEPSGSDDSSAANDAPITPQATDEYGVELRLLGLLPVQRAKVSVVPQIEVVPSGQAVGILLSQQGLIVVRTVPVSTRFGAEVSPARDAGILPGDILISAGGTPIHHPLDLQGLAEYYGRRNRPLSITLLRKGIEVQTQVIPAPRDVTGPSEAEYALGLQLKDPAAGVGTLTFWDPVGGAYGALGHMVTEGGEALALGAGRIVPAVIHGIQPGMRGRPGEKIGLFGSGASLGVIEKNTAFGIFGHLDQAAMGLLVSADRKAVPVALAHEVRTGKAEILTVVEGDEVRSFEVEIIEVERQSRPTGKGLVIEVTDPELIARTNGIVQGMSGSPILQDGKLVGAITHVFINNPRRGFGVLAEWMVYEAGLTEWRDVQRSQATITDLAG